MLDHMTPEQKEGMVSAIKISSVWGAVGISSWAELASALAALYTVVLLCEWAWKRIGRPFAESRGWIKRRTRRRDDFATETDRGDL